MVAPVRCRYPKWRLHRASIFAGKSFSSKYGMWCASEPSPGPYACGEYTSLFFVESTTGFLPASTKFSPQKNSAVSSVPSWPTPSTNITHRMHFERMKLPMDDAAAAQSSHFAPCGSFRTSAANTFQREHRRAWMRSHASFTVSTVMPSAYHNPASGHRFACRRCKSRRIKRPRDAARSTTRSIMARYEAPRN